MISPEPDSPDKRLQLYVDGSMSTSIFMPSTVDADMKLPLNVYVIINSQMMEVRNHKPVDISAEALEEVMRTVLQRSAYEMFLGTALAGGNFYILGIPENLTISTPQYEFTPELSKSLYDLGLSMGQQSAWRNEPPRFDSLTNQLQLDKIRTLIRR
ncbi:MAG: hypothetical protein CK529_04795 [Rhodospirillaceae bacterium]|nr:MAG: hypothetical protein CK529_04795 [Rhodospirillaceae bacterium]